MERYVRGATAQVDVKGATAQVDVKGATVLADVRGATVLAGKKGTEGLVGKERVKVREIDKVWLSVREAKEYLDIKDAKTLDRLAREEGIEVSVLSKKLVYYSKRGIDLMLERHAFFYGV